MSFMIYNISYPCKSSKHLHLIKQIDQYNTMKGYIQMKKTFGLHISDNAYLDIQRLYGYIYNYRIKQTDKSNNMKGYNQIKRKIGLDMVIRGIYAKCPLSNDMKIW